MDPIKDILDIAGLQRLRTAIEKRAGFWQAFKSSLSTSNMGREVAGSLMGAVAGAGIAAAGVGASKGISALSDRISKPRHFKAMIEATPGLKKEDATKTQMAFNTLWNLNKDLAKDPLTAGSFVGTHVHKASATESGGVYVAPDTAMMLTRAGGRRETPVLDSYVAGIGRKPEPERPPQPSRFRPLSEEADLEKYRAQLRMSKRPGSVKNPWAEK